MAAPSKPDLAYCPIPDPSLPLDDSILHQSSSDGIVPGHFRGRSLLSVSDLSRPEIRRLLTLASFMRDAVLSKGSLQLARGCLMGLIFFESSTRTSSSFQAAMQRLGGMVVPIMDVARSSVMKGETLEDTMRCLQCYANIIVMRHPETGSAARAASVLDIPLINAGDGIGEHPTQALLDLYTIQAEFGRIEGLNVTMVGDLKYGRTVHSLAKLLTHFPGKINLVSPESLRMPDSVKDVLRQHSIPFTEHTSLDEVMSETDVLYVTRVQRERFDDLNEYERVKDAFIITPELLTRLHAKSSLRILHPLPRVNELHLDLDKDPRAAYFRQMKHGMHMRMAIIAALLGKA